MITRIVLLGALLFASIAYLFSGRSAPQRDPYIQGKNRTILFFTNSEPGLSNVHLATSSALLENYPDIDIHYASFPAVRQKVESISSMARVRIPAASDIIFHELQGLTFAEAIVKEGRLFISPPGWTGIATLAEHIQLWISPWHVEDHLQMFEELTAIIEAVNPAVVVLDPWFRPAIDTTRQKNRQHAFISPNTLVDHFLGSQPLWNILWKYPAASSGKAFPVPLKDIPENIYMNMRYIYAAMMTPDLSAKKAVLREKGLKDPINLFGIHRTDAPWITQVTENAMIPVDSLPSNVTCAGPIILSGATAFQQDPELAVWMKGAPTLLINLGSQLPYDEQRATAMSIAISEVLSRFDVQIIWKFNKMGEYSDSAFLPLKPYLDSKRLRMPRWLIADPSSLLETGDIIVSVHHGGSNCYHEAIAAGMPQVVLPLWADLYNYAALAENIGVGIWGCKETTPEWTSGCLTDSLSKALDGAPHGVSIRNKAKELANEVQARERGRDIAAREIAKLAYVQ